MNQNSDSIVTAQLPAMLMDRYPIIAVIGAAILGRITGGMVMTDQAISSWLHPSGALICCFEGSGKYLVYRNLSKAESKESIPEPAGLRLEKELIRPQL